ncbi:MAG: hypothetical protein U0470_11790 [Anaerolineae bacterium]
MSCDDLETLDPAGIRLAASTIDVTAAGRTTRTVAPSCARRATPPRMSSPAARRGRAL